MGGFDPADLRELLELLREQSPPAPDPGRPIPPDLIYRFAELQPHQRKWLAAKREEDLQKIDTMLKDYEAAMTIGRAGKWLFWLVAGFFGTSFAAAKFGFDVIKWLKGAP